jgi:hypothetical protein
MNQGISPRARALALRVLASASIAASVSGCSPGDPAEPAVSTSVQRLTGSGLRVEARDEAPWEPHHVKPRLVIENQGSAPLADFTASYYFTVEPGKVPVLEDWYTPSCAARLERITGTTYAVVYDFAGFTLNPGQSVPDASGSVVGLHHSDWSPWRRSDDWSYLGLTATFAPTTRVVVRDENGQVVHGTGPFGESPSSSSRGVRLDGSGDFVQFDDENAFDVGAGDFTLAAWVRIPSQVPSTGSYTIAGKNRAGIVPGSHPGYRLAWSNGQTLVHVDNGTTRFSAGAAGVLQRERWHHVAGIRNGTQLALYVDGVLIDTEALPAAFSVENDRPFAIGASFHSSPERFFRGDIDNAALFRRALSIADLRALADHGANIYEGALVGYWPFDAGDARDAGTAENDGSFQGNATSIASPLADDLTLELDGVAGFEYPGGWSSAELELSSAPPFRGTASLRVAGGAGSVVSAAPVPIQGGDTVSFMLKMEGTPPPVSWSEELRVYYGRPDSSGADALLGSVVLDATYLDRWQQVVLPIDPQETDLLRMLEELIFRMERIPNESFAPVITIDNFRPFFPSAGAEDDSCPAGQERCSGECVDVDTDVEHCGSCGNACTGAQRCCSGACTAWEKIVGSGPPLASVGACGALEYRRYANQGQSNEDHVLPDFSYAGYRGGGVRVPHARVREVVEPSAGDDGALIQAAIDRVSARPRDEHGFRGAVLLKRGTYELGELFTSDTGERYALRIAKSGVVLRGEGQGSTGTILRATAPEEHTLILIEGTGSGLPEESGTRTEITSPIVPVGSKRFEVASAVPFAAGDTIVVQRTPNQAWVDAIGMDADSFPNRCRQDPPENDQCDVPWAPESYAIRHQRKVVRVDGDELTVDIPIVDTIEDQFGSGEVYRVAAGSGHIGQSGVERLRLESTYDSEFDEAHGWTAVHLRRTQHSWVKQTTAQYFGLSAVRMDAESNFNTVEEVAHLDPVSEEGGGRRYSLYVEDGIGNLFQRSFARGARHSFVTSSRVTGPNVWLDCLATQTLNDDGPHHRWATGLLFDNVSTPELHVQNRFDSGSGHGWTGAQVMFWNSAADSLISDAPHGAMNWIVGSNVEPGQSEWMYEPPGLRESTKSVVTPRSLYLQQLQDRRGTTAVIAVTTPEQRAGRIWNELEAWAGEAELFPDPTCERGLEKDGVCCASSCGTCGGSGCGRRDGASDSCCIGVNQASNRSCLEYGPPCLLPDPTCAGGILDGDKCCASSCGTCGGDDCSDREGGSAGCCAGPIGQAGRSCSEYPPPCVIDT